MIHCVFLRSYFTRVFIFSVDILMAASDLTLFSCRGIMKTSICLMTGVAFTFGMLVGLLVRLPVVAGPGRAASLGHDRPVRNVGQFNAGGLTDNYLVDSIARDPQFDYSPNNRRKDLGLNVEETVPTLSFNSAIISSIDNRAGLNRDHGLSQQSQYRAPQNSNDIGQVNRPELQSNEGHVKLDRPTHSQQEFTQGQNVLRDAGSRDSRPPGQNGVMVNLNANQDKFQNIPQDLKLTPDSDLNNNNFKTDHMSSSNGNSFDLKQKFNKLSDIIRGIQWSGKLEKLCPSGFSEDIVSSWKKQVFDGKVVHLTEGCGRMQNRLITLQDSSKACARYRPNTDQIQGEIYSYHLAKILGITNVPPTVMTMVNSVEPKWERVNQEISMSQWVDEKLVVLTRWLDNLEPAYIPKEFREQSRQLNPEDKNLLNKSLSELCELVQWSDLIVFDYLTANLDRIVNNMFNQQWNSQMMESPAHNLEKDKTSGRLVFLDNESGLLHGYRLLDKYAPYHEALLESVCVFRDSTVKSVEKLFFSDNIGEELQKSLVRHEVYHEQLPQFPDSNAKILNERLGKVYDKIQRCRLAYESR